jgi:hypothetical protein
VINDRDAISVKRPEVYIQQEEEHIRHDKGAVALSIRSNREVDLEEK